MGDESKVFWGQRTYCIITGASQGLGRNLAKEFASKFGSDSLLLLLARSESGLSETKRLIMEAYPKTCVKVSPYDLSNPNSKDLLRVITSSLAEFEVTPSDFDLAMIVHNAGSIGDLKEYTSIMDDPEKLRDYFSLNLFSAICLNSQFLSVFSDTDENQRLVINITSLCALKPVKSLGYYCMGKASREMFFNVLAKENSKLTVLNYSPGPVNTAMIADVISNVKDEETKQMFISMRDSQSILSVDQTTERLIKILEQGTFKSGARIDYFDKNQ